jgi:hypothetical protein
MIKLLLRTILWALVLIVPLPTMAKVDVGINTALPSFIEFAALPEMIVTLEVDVYTFPELSGGGGNYDKNLSASKNNTLYGGCGIDRDGFAINQCNDPYQGATYRGSVRSAGLKYLKLLLYSNMIGRRTIRMVNGYLLDKPYKKWEIQPKVGNSYFSILLNYTW